MQPKYPGLQHMRSFVWATVGEVRSNVEYCKRVMQATDADILITTATEDRVFVSGNLVPSVAYTVEWYTYAGWRVYMLLTGALTPAQESVPHAG